MMNEKNYKIDKTLTLMIIALVIMNVCSMTMLNMSNNSSNKNITLANVTNPKGAVVYEPVTFGTKNNYDAKKSTILDEKGDYTLARIETTFYLLKNGKVIDCDYLKDEKTNEYNYRYCYSKTNENSYVIVDFSNLKLEENDSKVKKCNNSNTNTLTLCLVK